ncbi:MAG: hypothetical protein H6716_20815 [Polyangiaceae bacterium]|nr:hypothetical protein [Polyangiaceae bacterium]
MTSADPEQGWTRRQVADYMRVSVSTVRRLEDEGALTPTRTGDQDTRRHDPQQVRALHAARQKEGQETGDRVPVRADARGQGTIPYDEIFRLFESGLEPVGIVMETGIPPAQVREALEAYYDLRNNEMVGVPALERLATVEAELASLADMQAQLNQQLYARCRCPRCHTLNAPWVTVQYGCCGAHVAVPSLHPASE